MVLRFSYDSATGVFSHHVSYIPRLKRRWLQTKAQSRLSKPSGNFSIKPSNERRRVAIIGGGITGLSAALRLSQDPSTKVTIFESSSRLGGWLQSEIHQVDGGHVVFDYGPRTLQARPTQSLPVLSTV